MITVEANPKELPCVAEDLHDMLEEGVELMHGRAVTAVLGNGKVEALQLHPARFSGAINASPITVNREVQPERFHVDNVIIAVGQRASIKWLPDEFKTERGTIKIDKFGRLGDTKFLRCWRHCATRFRSAAHGGECGWRREARRVQSG